MREYTCKTCRRKKRTPKDTGRLPSRCPDCQPTHRQRGARDREAARKASKAAGSATRATSAQDSALERFAVWLGRYPSDPEVAARRAGLDLGELDLADAVELAEMRHAGLIVGDAEALDELLCRVTMLCAIDVLDRLPEMAPRDALNGIERAVRARELAKGKGAVAWTAVDVYVDASEAP